MPDRDGGRVTEPHPTLAGEDLRFLKMSTKKHLSFPGGKLRKPAPIPAPFITTPFTKVGKGEGLMPGRQVLLFL